MLYYYIIKPFIARPGLTANPLTMPHRHAIIRALLLLLLLMQYAGGAHSIEHHLFDDPLADGQNHCAICHLHEQFGQSPAAGSYAAGVFPGVCESAPAPISNPLHRPPQAFHSRAPPFVSLN